MIFITFGTQPHQFEYLVTLINSIDPNEQLICQIGHTKNTISHPNCQVFDFTTEYLNIIENCELLITHSGVGSIMSGLELQKKVITVARLQSANEHSDNHQLEIADKLASDGYVYKLERTEDINEVIASVRASTFKKYMSNTDYFVANLIDVLESLHD